MFSPKILARVLLLAFALGGALYLATLDYGKKLSTQVLDLIPATERSPEVALVRSLANERQARALLIALRHATPTAAETFLATLRAQPAIAEAVAMSDTSARDALGTHLFQNRFTLLLPTYLAENSALDSATLAEASAQNLDRFLVSPEALPFQDLLPRDPLLLVPTLALNASALQSANTAPTDTTLIWALSRHSPLTPEGQQPVFDAITAATIAAQQASSLLTPHTSPPPTDAFAVSWTGVARFANHSETKIRSEISTLNTASLIAVLAVALLFIRQVWKALHLIPVVALSTLGAWLSVTLVYERVHVLVFVVGSLLAGVAIDYAFYLYIQPALRTGETYAEKVRRLLKPLLVSCLTTVLGFAFLLGSPLPLIHQLGVYVAGGLITALAAALLYFAQVNKPYLAAREFTLRLPKLPPRASRLILFFLSTVTVIGLTRLRWHDDIRQLDIASPHLLSNDKAVRALCGETPDRTLYRPQGPTPAAARASLDAFHRWHAENFPGTHAASLGLLLPTEENLNQLPARLAQLRDFPEKFRTALERHGYTAEAFEPFFTAWADLTATPTPPAYDQLLSVLKPHRTGPLSLLLQTPPASTLTPPASHRDGEAVAFFATIVDHPANDLAPPPALNTVGLNQLETLNNLFTRYRSSALHLSSLGLGVIGLSVFLLYGPRRGIRIFLIPAGSCLLAFGLLGLLGQTMNLFHLLGAFLGVCLSHNYAIFSAENANRREPPPPSIRLSALTTAASFAVLAISSIPVIASLGSSVALIVLCALLFVELEPLTQQNARPVNDSSGR